MADTTPEDDLMTLISSLSKNEKRYFKLHSSQGVQKGETVYMQLYHHLASAGRWDEDQIRKTFEGQAFLQQLIVARTRLYQLILASLRDYDQEQSLQLDFSRRMDEIEVLYRRKLVLPCERLVKTALARATALEAPVQLLSLIEWSMRLERQKGAADIEARLKPWHLQYQVAMEQIHCEAALLQLHDALIACLPQYTENKAINQDRARQLLTAPVLNTPQALLSFEGKKLYHYIFSHAAIIAGDVDAYAMQQKLLVGVWESSRTRMRYEEENYFRALVAYAESLINASGSQSAEKVIAKIKRLMGRSRQIQKFQNGRVLLLELFNFVRSEQWEMALNIEPAIDACLAKFGTKIPTIIRLGLLSNTLTVQFYLGRWPQTLQYATRLEADARPQAANQWQSLIRAARWVAWYELGEHDALEKSMRNLRKSEPADIVCGHFADLLAATTAAQEQEVFAALENQLVQPGSNDTPVAHSLLHTWANSKRRNRSR